jgi:hypothetical protein
VRLDQPQVRYAGLRRIAFLTLTAARASGLLRRRARLAGLRWSEVTRTLPDVTGVVSATENLLTVIADDGDGDAAGRLDGATVARPPIRTGQPLTELRDRITSLGQTAWEQQHSDEPALGDLTAIASAALAWLTAIRRCPAPAAVTSPQPLAMVSATATAAWTKVRALLCGLTTLTGATPAVQGNAARLRQLLRDITELTDTGDSTPHELENVARIHDTLAEGIAVVTEIAVRNRTTLSTMQRRAKLWVPSSSLTRDELSEHPTLADEWLHRRYVRALPRHVTPVLDAYTAAGQSLLAEHR